MPSFSQLMSGRRSSPCRLCGKKSCRQAAVLHSNESLAEGAGRMPAGQDLLRNRQGVHSENSRLCYRLRMKTILTPVDFSGVTSAVVSEAAALARALHARVVLFAVVQ